METIEQRLTQVEEMFYRINDHVSIIIKEGKSCREKLQAQDRDIQELKDVVEKMYIQNHKILQEYRKTD